MSLGHDERAGSLLPVFGSLKLRLLLHGFRANRRSRIASLVMLCASVGGGVTTAISFVNDYADGPQAWSRSIVPGFTLVFLAWVFGPLLLGGIDDALDPRRLALLPLRPRELAGGLTLGAVIGFLPIGTVLALGGVLIAYVHQPSDALVVFACMAEVALAVSTSRLVAVLLAQAANSRRGRDLSVIAASATAALLWLATQGIGAFGDQTVDRINGALRWTPPGMVGAAVVDVATGERRKALLRIVAVAVLASFAFRSWAVRTQVLLTSTPAAHAAARRDRPVPSMLRLLARVANRLGGPRAGAVFVKDVRYLVRSPARRSALVVSTVMGVPFVVLQVLRSGGFDPGCVRYAPAALLFGLGSVNNLIGADAASLWLEMCSGARLREILIGRGLASVPFLVIPSLVAAGVLASASMSTESLVVVVALVATGWGVPLGVGSYLSVRAPFAQSDDQNPFSNTRAVGAPSSMVVLTVAALGTLVVAVLALPVIWLAATISGSVVGLMATVMLAAVYGTGVWLGFVALAVRRVQRRGTDLVSALSTRSALT
jgi:ABC-2 type transport system permease protein